ncbi:MAG: DUF262 domain-containing protein [Bacteroidetes bacterium]|nr:MAG: DUF262 domain-containing protein [Bacteroidota bacterium]REK03792.1 MAG: DUF262 domain-containing protein [Bacteroidota bacterium]REK48735.1 MAG: DUF262 domain-containing protein [Bacteroidota bacterium]
MQAQKYSVNQHQISTFLAFVKDGQIAIPEVQRPFVWETSRVRDLMDSLYKGYPVGYVITWQNPDVRLKDGSMSHGKKILIDGQQRITALKAAVLGDWVVNDEYDKVRIKIAFNPVTETFEVQNPAILKDKIWISDISEIMNAGSLIQVITNYCKLNADVDSAKVENAISNLLSIQHKQIGVIELAHDLDIDTVTEIFVRINSKGVALSQADFAMSKMAANENLNGHNLRKAVDYFCHLAVAPQFHEHIRDHDKDFSKSEFFNKMIWLKDEKDDLYDPDYTDMLRVTFTYEFHRGKLSDLVSLLSGRNFVTKEYEESIAADTYSRMSKSVINFMNENNFKKFLMIIRSTGFIIPQMIRSQNSLNFAYILYLKLKSDNLPQHDIEKYVRRWFVYSILTSRYGGSPESTIDYDIKQIATKTFVEYFKSVEEAELSDSFWEFGLVQRLETAAPNSPFFNLFLASLIKSNAKGFLSRDITVQSLVETKGDIHHIFPKSYLKKNQKSRTEYNQIANFVIMQQEINIAIGAKSPEIYFTEIKKQCENGKIKYGGINSMEELAINLNEHCIPESIFEMNVNNYIDFLKERRKLISMKIKKYYRNL